MTWDGTARKGPRGGRRVLAPPPASSDDGGLSLCDFIEYPAELAA
ncbi:hypothetical protein [Mycolicibacterium moriokaense]|nr:hypothetical protein [Mycolicibacterium moriokaense]